jgi:hypothetical protein
MARRKTSDKTEWSFSWLCRHCDRPRFFLVVEVPGVEAVARCPKCTSLIPVTDEHRRLSVLRSTNG